MYIPGAPCDTKLAMKAHKCLISGQKLSTTNCLYSRQLAKIIYQRIGVSNFVRQMKSGLIRLAICDLLSQLEV